MNVLPRIDLLGDVDVAATTDSFQPFDERGEVRIYEHGILPHWRQDGCTYFVTFRTADSLPQSVRDRLKHARVVWLRKHDIDANHPDWKRQFAKLSPRFQRQYEREIGDRLNQQLDRGFGACLLRQPAIAEIVVEALEFHEPERMELWDYVIMPNHVHALMKPKTPDWQLEDLLKSIKVYSARRINEQTGDTGQRFWQKESYDHIVRDRDQLRAFQRYIRANPEKANLPEGDYTLRRSGDVHVAEHVE